VYERVVRDGRPGLVIERVEGTDLLTLVTRRPWSLRSVARRCGRLHAELHATLGPTDLPTTKELVSHRLSESAAVPDALREEALASLDALPDGDRLCHGDFHPGNVLQADDRAVVIDWTTATRGDPVADVARTWVLLEFSPLPPGSSLAQRALTRIGRGLLLSGYTRAYARAAPLDSARFAAWTRLRAIERLTEEVEGEREAILDRLEQARQ
jgi:aminoglycoside phosphotransferase (APT) family kinase protein